MMLVYVTHYEASGCHPESSDPEPTLVAPDVADDHYVSVESFLIESTDEMWAILLRTARCCGTDHVVRHIFDNEMQATDYLAEHYADREAPRNDWEDREDIDVKAAVVRKLTLAV